MIAGDTDHSAPVARTVVGLGELIWDMLPGGKSMGGAPSNFAYHSRLLGDRAVVASRVGDDEPGREALRALRRAGVEAGFVQVDSEHPTGMVGVEIDVGGEPHFTVNPNSAWDYLELSQPLSELARRTDAVAFGTLGQRHPLASETILSFVGLSSPGALRLFDVNLRHSFFSAEMLARSLELASVVKFNSDEVTVAARMLGLHASDEEEFSRRLIEEHGLDLVAVTRGEKGSVLFTQARKVEHAGYKVKVADTIGCGDAFASALAHCLLRGLPLETASETANRLGAWVATQAGGTPKATPQIIEGILGGRQV